MEGQVQSNEMEDPNITQSENRRKKKKGSFDATKVFFMPNSRFEDFIKKKEIAFSFFMNHSSTSSLFEADDVDSFLNISDKRHRQTFGFVAGVFISFVLLDQFIRFKNIPLGLTYNSSLSSRFWKLYLPLVLVSGVANRYFFNPSFLKAMEPVFQKYSFNENPIFLKTFEEQKIRK